MLAELLICAAFGVGQAEAAPPPQKLPVAEGTRPAGSLPSAAEVALPSAASSPCPSPACDCPMGPAEANWTHADFLYYWFQPAPLPSLVTSNGVTLNNRPAAYRVTSGAGIYGGRWINDCHTIGFGYGLFMTEQRANFFTATSDANGSPALTRPFIDALTNQPNNFFVADPGRLAGTVSVETGARLAGGELYGLKNIRHGDQCNFNLLAGFRYLDLDEYMVIFQQTSSLTNRGGALPAFTVAGMPTTGPISIVDRFRTRNQFWGGEIGGQGEVRFGRFVLGATSKIGVGNVHQTLDIAGQTSAPGVPSAPGGLLALSTNIGTVNYNRIAVLADVSAQLGFELTERSRVFAGYDFVYLNDVIRPGTQVDGVISTRFVPSSANFGTLSGPVSPIRTRAQNDFYVHGLRFGFEMKY